MFAVTAVVLALSATSSQAFFFGGGSSCGCSAPPACPPPPPPAPCGGGGGYAAAPAPIAYAPAPAYAPTYSQGPVAVPSYSAPAPAVSYGSSYAAPQVYAPQAQPIGGGGYAAPVKRNVDHEDTGVDQSEGYRRVKRDDEAVFDPKCNSEDLKTIILQNISENTAESKRKIQAAAADAIGGRVDVICSRSTFSYIVNTELYCETEQNGTTCFAFKQSS
ncbi:unnamed protein product [Caenorhabditis bovis]|uniref:Ground-like domain-containing protein n=1 Tax=Caenorhabditis bovis TaxID=2654633 RepID=A0A8S1EAL1_9PELO|nr:unnamed protein product [Caenorhabditis bovis]